MKPNPKVTVLMSVFNETSFLTEAIESILSQTFKDFELLIIDDYSQNPETVKILDNFAKKDKRIRIERHEGINWGLTRSLNQGIKIAKGEYIARMDADDISLKSRLEKQADYLDKNPDVNLVGCFGYVIDENGEKTGQEIKAPVDFDKLKKSLFWRNLMIHSGLMFRRDVAMKTGGYDEQLHYAQDYDLYFRFLRFGKIGIIPEFFILWRKRKGSISQTKRRKQEMNALAARFNAIRWGVYPFIYFVLLPIFLVKLVLPAKTINFVKNKL